MRQFVHKKEILYEVDTPSLKLYGLTRMRNSFPTLFENPSPDRNPEYILEKRKHL